MNNKQLALVYLMEECNKIRTLCTMSIHNTNKKNLTADLEHSMGVLFNAMREVVVEFKLKEKNVESALYEEMDNRNKE
jgi:hypothetical protein